MAMTYRIDLDDCQQRQQHDDGDPDDVVLRASRSHANPAAYHEDRECIYWQTDRQRIELTRREVQEAGLAPCMHCVLEWELRKKGSPSRERCPACGGSLGDMDVPQHMRSGECEVVA